jgi:hypothetical protein
MYRPEVAAFDVETTGLDFWSPSFRVISAAFSWFTEGGSIKNIYLEGEQDVLEQLRIMQEHGIKLITHNASYELGVLKYRFPSIPTSVIAYDTMRLAQVYDNGGSDAPSIVPTSVFDELDALEGKKAETTGLGLERCVNRILPGPLRNYKQPYYKWLREHAGVKAGQEGANLQLLPADLLEAYNTSDTDATLLLYDKLTKYFAEIAYDFRLDHQLHMSASLRIAEAKARGLRVDRQGLAVEAGKLEAEIAGMKDAFVQRFAKPIAELEEARYSEKLACYKTERGREKATKAGFPDDLRFNPQSTSQLGELFIGKLGIAPTFWTKEGKASKKRRQQNPDLPPFTPNPSFKAAHLHSYGDGGSMLVNVKRRGLVLTQNRTLSELSALDGRWHQDLKACGTKTGRYAGGGGLNVQGLARREAGLLSYVLPEDGYSFVSVDLSAGEPSVTSHYSKDKNYYAACFGMVGRAPYYDQNGILQIDDIYLMGASVAPTGKQAIRDAFEADWGGRTFSERWLRDPEEVKTKLKKTRSFHKVLMLALQYGQGPRGMVHNAYDNGLVLSLGDAQAFHHAYWHTLFPGVRVLGERLKAQLNVKKCLVNPFGYRMVPEADRLALNYFIQSSVSGLMKVLEEKFYAIASYALPVVVVHDEIIMQVPTDKLEEAKEAMRLAVESLNNDLNWSVKIRTGWQPGENLYAAK